MLCLFGGILFAHPIPKSPGSHIKCHNVHLGPRAEENLLGELPSPILTLGLKGSPPRSNTSFETLKIFTRHLLWANKGASLMRITIPDYNGMSLVFIQAASVFGASRQGLQSRRGAILWPAALRYPSCASPNCQTFRLRLGSLMGWLLCYEDPMTIL